MRNSTNDPGASSSPVDTKHPASEADYLTAQVQAAQDSLAATIERMRADLKDSADLPAWTRKYPWPSLGIAAAFGFLAVKTLSAKAAPPAASATFATNGHQDHRAAPSPPSMFSTLMAELIRNLMSALQGIITAAVSAKMAASQQQSPSEASSGATDSPPSTADSQPLDPQAADF